MTPEQCARKKEKARERFLNRTPEQRERVLVLQRARRAAMPTDERRAEQDKQNAARRALVAANSEVREARNATQRDKYASRNPEQIQHTRLYMYRYGLKRRFSITVTKWLAIFSVQGERCACCRSASSGKRWHTDHDHSTGHIRGIVCVGCNTSLGRLGDNLHAAEESAERFTSYLKSAEGTFDAAGRLIPWEPK